MKRSFFRGFLLSALAALMAWLALPAGGEDNSPKERVVHFMEALKAKNYAAALTDVGLDLPKGALDKAFEVLDKQPFFIWRLKDYTVREVRQDGGLALVTVEEVHFKDLDANLRARLARTACPLSDTLRWGDNRVTETFVLVRLDGRWQFDTTHSGVDVKRFPLAEIFAAAQRNERPSDELQVKIGQYVNQVGFGQIVQSIGSGGPIVPMLAAVALPNFARARSSGQLTACKSNLKNIGTALEMYSTDSAGRYPTALRALTPEYLPKLPTCPTANAETYSSSYEQASNPDNYTVFCSGTHHQSNGLPANFPQYTSTQGLIERP